MPVTPGRYYIPTEWGGSAPMMREPISVTAGANGSFGELLRHHRRAAGLTQEDLAGRSGLSVRAISAMERGRTAVPYPRSVRLLANALALSDAERAVLQGAVPGESFAHGTGPAEGVQSDQLPHAVRKPAQLPPDIFEFTGRTEQIGWLRGVLAGGRQRRDGRAGPLPIAAITGAGGLGKSALAIHAAHQLAAQFPDGQLFVELNGSLERPLATADALHRLLRHLGMRDADIPASQAELVADYRSQIAGRRMLIVLDDALDAAQVRPLLPGTASAAALVTSRGWLAGLEGSRLLSLDALDAGESRKLFARICGAERVAAEPDATSAVLAACAGLPLAVRIAASRLVARPGWDISSLARQLSDSAQRLEILQAGDLALRASFEVSYTALPQAVMPGGDDMARAFRLLGLWPGHDISLPAAAALLGLDDQSASRVLETLVDAHLLESPAAGRYRFHDLIRVFAGERAASDEKPESRKRAIRRLLSWYLHSADRAQSRLALSARKHAFTLVPAEAGVVPMVFGDYDIAADWSDAERAHLVAAVLLAARHLQHRLCAQLAAVAWRDYLRSPWDGWTGALRTGVDSAIKSGDRQTWAWLLNDLGVVMLYRGEIQEALACLETALPLSHQAADKMCEAAIATHLAIAFKELKRYDRAIAHFETALSIHRAADSKLEGSVLMNLGMLCVEVGRLQEGVNWMEHGLAVQDRLGDRAFQSLAHSQLADAYRQLGRIDEAICWARDALEISRRVRDQYQEAAALYALGRALADAGDSGQAHSCLVEAHALAGRLGVPQAAEIKSSLMALGAAGSEPA
jgi:tetratricopeptide (TPR) repeat protein/transcriptional regulator with XRE-family HTH domain